MSPSGTGGAKGVKKARCPQAEERPCWNFGPIANAATRTCRPQADALICTYECTFCRDCGENVLKGVCPNCGGNLVTRPIWPAAKLAQGPRLDRSQAETGRLHEPASV